MHFFSNNLGDHLNNILLQNMTNRKIKFYDIRKKALKSQYDINENKLNEIAKTDLFFIGSILGLISNSHYHFHGKEKNNKGIISKWYFKIYDYFHPLIIFGAGFGSRHLKKESYVRKIIYIKNKWI